MAAPRDRAQPRKTAALYVAHKICCPLRCARFYVVPPAGIEPTTSWFEARRSIQLSYRGR